MADGSAWNFHQIPEAWRIDLVIPIYKTKSGRVAGLEGFRCESRGGHFVCVVDGLSVEGHAHTIWLGHAIYAYFQEWVELGVFAELWELALTEYDDLKGIDWKWQTVDGAMTKAPLGGEKNREKPDRSWNKLGVKRSTLIDGRGVPLAVAVEARMPDQKLLADTLDAIPGAVALSRPASSRKHLCLDKGYTGEPVDRQVRQRGYTPHVPCKTNEAPEAAASCRQGSTLESRTYSLPLNRRPAATHPLGKKGSNYLGFLHLQFAIVALRTAKVLQA